METGDTDSGVADAMIEFGGSFVQALGKLFRQADADNQRRLKTAFPEYWKKYSELARSEKHRG